MTSERLCEDGRRSVHAFQGQEKLCYGGKRSF